MRATIDSDIMEDMVRAAWVGKMGMPLSLTAIISCNQARFGGAVLQPAPAPDFSKASVSQAEEIAVNATKGSSPSASSN